MSFDRQASLPQVRDGLGGGREGSDGDIRAGGGGGRKPSGLPVPPPAPARPSRGGTGTGTRREDKTGHADSQRPGGGGARPRDSGLPFRRPRCARRRTCGTRGVLKDRLGEGGVADGVGGEVVEARGPVRGAEARGVVDGLEEVDGEPGVLRERLRDAPRSAGQRGARGVRHARGVLVEEGADRLLGEVGDGQLRARAQRGSGVGPRRTCGRCVEPWLRVA